MRGAGRERRSFRLLLFFPFFSCLFFFLKTIILFIFVIESVLERVR